MQVIKPLALKDCRRGEHGLVLGNGPSLEWVDFERLKKHIVVVGVHRTWRQVNPPFHVILRKNLYFDEILEGKWEPEGIIVTRAPPPPGLKNNVKVCQVSMAHNRNAPGIISPLHLGTNAIFCGHFALEVAVYLGLSRIYLIGYDMMNGSGHAYIPRDKDKISWDSTRERQRKIMNGTAQAMKRFYPHVEVFNLNERSAMKSYPFLPIDVIHN